MHLFYSGQNLLPCSSFRKNLNTSLKHVSLARLHIGSVTNFHTKLVSFKHLFKNPTKNNLIKINYLINFLLSDNYNNFNIIWFYKPNKLKD